MPGISATDRPWLDASRPIEERVTLLLGAMTLAEKAGQLTMRPNLDPADDGAELAAGLVGSTLYASGATAGNVRDQGLPTADLLACQRIAAEESRLGLPLLVGRDVIHGHRTVFPIPLGLAATWDEDLVRRCAETAGAEALADDVDWTFAPMVDLSEEPRWGRVAESLGEQPVLAGRLAAAMVEGFQAWIAACAKHFVGYGLVEGGRDCDTVSVGENTLRNLHLRPFRDAVGVGVATVMAAFTDVDGVPMHAHRHLLRDVLKGEWGFDGVVVADWDGIGQLVPQGVAVDLRDAARQAILAGVDVDMVSGAYAHHLPDLVAAGEVPVDVVDDAVRRVLRLKFRRGLLDAPRPEPNGPVRITPESRVLARAAAVASMVLVKNAGVLPLSADPGRVHLTGPFAEEGEAWLGTWVVDGVGSDVVSPATALRERRGDVLVTDGRFSDLALVRAREADVTVALVGEHPVRSGEDHGVSTLGLPPGQLEALEALAALGKPIVAVVVTGRPLEIGRVLDLADAVIVAWHPGIEAGPAPVDILLGVTAPSGRLPMTFPRSAGHIPTSTHQRPTGRPIPAAEDRQRGRYLDALVTPELPFGFGRTYTSFAYGPVVLDTHTLPVAGGKVTASVEVTNTGDREGREIVQLYVHDRVAAVTRPLVELADWRAVDVPADETVTVSFAVRPEMFGYYGPDLTWRVDPGEVDVLVGPHAESENGATLLLT
jgi:beta-glucosidase